MKTQEPAGTTPGPHSIEDADTTVSVEQLQRYLPPAFRGVIARLPQPTTPEARMVWRLAMRYAIRAHGRGWYRANALRRLAEMQNSTPEDLLTRVASEQGLRVDVDGGEAPPAAYAAASAHSVVA